MRILRRIYRVIALFLWGSWHGIYSLPIRYLYKEDHSISRMALQTKYWGGGIVKILGIRTIIHGSPEDYKKTGGLVVANHQSYVDVFLHASIFGLRFTPKKEIKSWPVLGWYTDMTRPIWVDRDSRQASGGLMEQFRDTLRHKVPLIVYPEGTTSDGRSGLKEFKTTPFETVCGTDIPVQPVISIYHPAPGDMHPAWYGDATFMPHLWALLGNRRSTADVYILPLIYPEGRNRKQLAKAVRDAMLKAYCEHTGWVPPDPNPAPATGKEDASEQRPA